MPQIVPQLQQLLNVAIVLVAIYATMSCACSWIQERIASLLALRGWGLFRGIAQLTNEALATQIFNHPIVAQNSPAPTREVRTERNGLMQFSNVAWSRPPSYLDARNFSSAFWQVLASAHLPALPASAAQALPNVAPATDSATALAQLVVGAPNDAIKHLEAAVQGSATIPDALRAQVLALLAAAQSDYGRLLAATDGWFNAQMDRVSGWYKRQSQWVMVVIALLVTTVSGIDTRDVIRTLSATDPCVLAQYAQQAGDMAQQSAGNAIPVPKGCTGAAAMAPLDVTNFAHVGFPNWTYEKDGYLRWPGMLLTLVALTLGGPFWFDALKALVNVRSAGRKPERTDQPPQ